MKKLLLLFCIIGMAVSLHAKTNAIPVLNLSATVGQEVTMQMENFRDGGEGVAYHDSEAANQAGAYRSEGVDISDVGGGNYCVSYTVTAEWLEYSINVPITGTYNFDFYVAYPFNDISYYIDYAGGSSSLITVPNTGGYTNWTPGSVSLFLWAGEQTIRFNIGGAGNLDRAVIKLLSASNKPITTLSSVVGTPVTMEMENYRDDGGEGVAYHDFDAPNQGLAYRRNQGVDISDIGGGNYCVSYVNNAEWLEYKIDVPVSGTYSFDFSVSAPSDVQFYIDCANGSGSSSLVTVPNTGGWLNWQTGSVSLNLWAGVQVIRFNVAAGGNLDKAIIKLVSDKTTALSSVIGQSVTMQMENYRDGGEGVAYHDLDVPNQGLGYRTNQGVDISDIGGGQYCVSYVAANEWLEYKINVPVAGLYNFNFYVAYPSNDISFNVGYAGGTSQTVTVPNTGGYVNWQAGSVQLNLVPGIQNIRFNVVNGGNLDRATISLSAIAPDAPTSVVVTAGNAKASVAFTAPASNGGSAITGYTVTPYVGATAGTPVTQNANPITVTGLTNGTAYTFTVKANNAAGASAESNASVTITPHATNNNIAVSSATNISALTLTPVSDIVVSGNKLTINAAKTVNSITVAPGAQLELISGNTLTAGTVILQSDATGTATLVDNTTTAPQAVTATVQQYVTSGRNWYMSIPLASGASSLLSRGTSVVCFDEPSGTWIAPTASTLNKLRGYVQVATSTPSVTGTTGTVDFTGVVNTGAHSITLSRTAGKTGFNLVGNPYPSYLDWNAVTKTNVSNTMWLRTKEGGVYKFYTYNTIDGAGGIGVPASVTRYIPPMQAFWVRVATEGTGSIAVDNNMRSHKDVSGNIMKVPSQTPQQLLRLQVSNGTNTDETVVYFNANASDAFDKYDAQKRSNGEPTVPEIYTQIDTEKLVINGMKDLKYNTEIPLGFSTLTANDFSISANEMTNFETGTHVILIDKLNPTVETELTNGAAYSFSAPITAPTTNRFSLLFRAPGVATGIENGHQLNAQVFVNVANHITIIAPQKSNYAIYNTVGQLIENGTVYVKHETRNTKLNAGVYVVKVNNQSTRVIIK